uniref:Reverse transcriptase domain-containing protein n=1 Tax=Tanacetum cinerariifolium TaxID=118510 RepID=A0A699HB45_TANCI|nr:reverse transcriptase domain-containing protein [Tanacetum cinerariifolium]
MRTRSKSYLFNSNATIPRHSNRRRVPNIVEPEIRTIKEVVPMADRTMEELLQAPMEGRESENPHTHISNFKRMTATLKYRDVPNDAIKLMLLPYPLEDAARIWYEKEPPNLILTWDDLDSLNAAAGGNLLNKTTREALKIIENKSKVRYLRRKSNVSRVNTNTRDSISKTDDRIDKHADQISNLVEIVNKQVITPASAKAVEKTCVTCGCAHVYYDCVTTDSNQPTICAATGSYNQIYSPNRASHQIPTPDFAPMQNNPNRYNQNQGQGNYFNQEINFNQGNNFNKGNNFQNNQGYRAPMNNALNFQNQGFQNQPFSVPNKQFQPCIPNELSTYIKSNKTLMRGMQNQINVLRGDFNKQEENLRRNLNNDMRNILSSFFQNQASTSGTILSNTMPNPKGEMKAVTTRSGLAYEGPSIPTNSPLEKLDEQNTKEMMDKEHSNCSGSIAQVQPPVVPISILEADVPRTQPKPTIPYPSILNDQKLHEKSRNQMEKFFQIFHDLNFDTSFVDALLLMPKFASTIKSLLTNKDKLFELAKVPLNENCSAMLLKKLPEKLGDPGKFLIPCDFPGMEVCHALVDLGASINLMKLSIWKKLSLPELTPTRMTLELVDRSITHPKGVAEDVFVKVGKFHFPTDLVDVDFEANPRVPIILERPFLRTGRALIDVYGEEITLRANDESYNPKSSNPTLVSDPSIPENDFSKDPIVKSSSPTLTPFGESDFFLEEIEEFLNDDLIPTEIDNSFYDPKRDILFLKKPPELELKELLSHLEYVFLEESNKLPVIIAKDLKDFEKEALINVLKSHKRAIAWKISDIKEYFQILNDPQDQKKTTFTCPYGTFAYRRMPFGLCNAPGTFQREWVVLGHKILKSGIEVDRAKVDIIAKLPHPTTIKGVSFLGHAGFYRRFIQDFSKIARPMTHLLEKKTPFVFSKESFDILKACNEGPTGDHHGTNLTAKKVFDAVDYLSKWVEAKSLPTNDARVVVKFLKSLFSRFGIPGAIISDCGTHFFNDEFTRVMIKYGVTHRLATAYHPQTSGQVEVSNRGLRRILEMTVGENRLIGLKHVNFDLKTAGDHRKLQLNELSELRDQAYENFVIYKERTNNLHGFKIKNHIFNVGDQVLLFNSRLKIFSEKLKTRWSGPFTITQVFLYGTIELSQPNGPNFKVNGHRVKHYFRGDIPSNVVMDLHTFPMDN